MSARHLFCKLNISDVIGGQKAAAKAEIADIPQNDLLSRSEHDLIQALVDKYRLHLPVIRYDEIHVAHSGEAKVDVRNDFRRTIRDRSTPTYVAGTEVEIAIPFTGDPGFFEVQGQTFSHNPPFGDFTKNEIILRYSSADHDEKPIRAEYERTLASITECLAWLSPSTEQFNNELEGFLTSLVQGRKKHLLAGAGMAGALGLPLKKRVGMPETYSVPVKRRVPKIVRSSISPAFTPEPVLHMQDYEEILRIIKNMTRVMELSPESFRGMGEEDLRTHFLVQLNGAFEGQATGETFNFQGKTDLLIRVDGKNVFIGECKFWGGEKAFLDTISQLLSYLSWRDTKTAVLVFNKNADFSKVLETIKAVVSKHPQYKRDNGTIDETNFRYVFSQPNDANRELTLTVMAFDIPTTPATAKNISAATTLLTKTKAE
jgi:hypothetical protein